MSGKPLAKEPSLAFTKDESTLSGLNETLARDGSVSAWLCGVRAINPRDKSHPASKAYDVRRALLLSSYGISLLFIERYCVVFLSPLLITI